MNEAWMDECAARLQPLVDQYKNPGNNKLSQKKKFRNLIVTTRSCPEDKKISFKKSLLNIWIVFLARHSAVHYILYNTQYIQGEFKKNRLVHFKEHLCFRLKIINMIQQMQKYNCVFFEKKEKYFL